MCENPGKVDMPAALAGNPQGRKGEAEQEAWSDGYAAGQADEAEDGIYRGMVIGAAIIAWAEAIRRNDARRKARAIYENYDFRQGCACMGECSCP